MATDDNNALSSRLKITPEQIFRQIFRQAANVDASATLYHLLKKNSSCKSETVQFKIRDR